MRRLKADPPRSATGFAGLNLEKYKAFNRPRGFISEENPNAKIQNLAEDIPERVLGQVLNVRLAKPERQMRPEALTHQRFEFLEAFRSVRSALWFMGENGDRPKTILVTSSSPQEGKSTVALYLAVTLAKAGSRVLLVDADLRRA